VKKARKSKGDVVPVDLAVDDAQASQAEAAEAA
jgi:hypothetical protein